MVTSDRFLQFIANLQKEGTTAQGRSALLKYIRRSSGAQLATLFTLDNVEQSLVMMAYSGQRPPNPATAGGEYKRLDTKHLPLNGLLAAALQNQGLLPVLDLFSDPRALMEERAWGWSGGRVILSSIKAGNQPDSEQGVLVLSFDPDSSKNAKSIQLLERQSDLLVCITLLSAYLSKDNKQASTSKAATHTPPISSPQDKKAVQTATVSLQEQLVQQSNFPEMMYSLSCLSELYEIGLAAAMDMELKDLYQHILQHMNRNIRAQGACLLLYEPARHVFISAASLGEDLACSAVANMLGSDEMLQLATHGPGEMLSSVWLNDHRMLLVTLSWHKTLLGVVALSITEEDVLLNERGLLLTYMGNVAALLLHTYHVRTTERKMVIEAERNRIARDLHDSVAQQLGHVLHKLELSQRYLEMQQLPSALIEVQQAYEALEMGLHDLQHSISSLLPLQVEQQGFSKALKDLLTNYHNHNPGIEISYDIDETNRVPAMLETTIFRFLQEALANIRKHARASQVAISFQQLSDHLVVEINDNGIGFQPGVVTAGDHVPASRETQHLGMQTMHERVQEAGGSLELQSLVGTGTKLRASFPSAHPFVAFTNREREVLRLIVAGLTNHAIAQQLSISDETVKTHIYHIIQKMHVKDRTHAAVVAARYGWL